VGYTLFLEEAETEENLEDISVALWVPSDYGWNVAWRINGKEFLDRCKLEEIK